MKKTVLKMSQFKFKNVLHKRKKIKRNGFIYICTGQVINISLEKKNYRKNYRNLFL